MRLKKEGNETVTNCNQFKIEEQENQLSSNIGQLKMKAIGLLIFLFITFQGNSQEVTDSLNVKLKNGAREIMISAGICTLITLDENGEARARAMDSFLPENDFTVWFGTNVNSRKVEQIKNDPRVTLYYLDSDGSGYVVIQGIAELISDSQTKEKWWKEEWEAFYPNIKEDYILIKVMPKSMEVLSPPRGINNDPVTWKPPTVVFEIK